MIGILSHLTATETENGEGNIDGEWVADLYDSPTQRFPLLSVADKLQVLDFLCSQAVMTKSVKSFYEECEAQVTELRKEKIEVSREKRKLAEAWRSSRARRRATMKRKRREKKALEEVKRIKLARTKTRRKRRKTNSPPIASQIHRRSAREDSRSLTPAVHAVAARAKRSPSESSRKACT